MKQKIYVDGDCVGFEEVPDVVVETPTKTLKAKVVSVFKPETSDGKELDSQGDGK